MNTRKTKSTTGTRNAKPGDKKSSFKKSTTTSSSKPGPKAKGTTGPKKETSNLPKDDKKDNRRFFENKERVRKGDPMPTFNENEIRLNKFLSNAGIASRREADVLIQTGVVSVNDVIITEMGYKIKPGDVIKYDGETINAEKKRYVLLNKPKDFIVTLDDPMGRKTVMSLVEKACKEVVYPIGKMEREATGLLLFTNDGDLIKKLTHPKYKANKIYHVETSKAISLEDIEKLKSGIFLDDGKIACTNVEFVKDSSPRDVGVELSSGKNKVVRRLFESLGYQVVKIDRVKYAGLTKKDLPRGFFRHLTEKEVAFLKMS
jgi:23S rRNA pseudouridine2605 synthase